MSTLQITVECPVFDSFRVQQVAGMFDVPLQQRATEQFRIELPDDFGTIAKSKSECSSSGSSPAPSAAKDGWKIGLIVGPSGSGKSTVAKRLFGSALRGRHDWAEDRAVIDGLGDRPIKQITGLFTAVGFSSPPSWVKPYRVLSNGEQFRCDLARALIEAGEELVVFDEFTSVVDRNVARVVSAAVAKGIHSDRIPCRFVAVTCHYDVTEWLQPDWVLDMASSTFQRRRLRRPPIQLEIVRCSREAWRLFARHHYLSGKLSSFVKCYLALWDGMPAAFCAVLPLIGHKNRRRISRIVTLPDYQGIGIGTALVETVAELHREAGLRMNITASHPAVIAHCRSSTKWKAVNIKKTGSGRADGFIKNYRSSHGRAVVSFEYRG